MCPVVHLLTGLFFLIAGEGLDIGRQIQDVLFGEYVTPARHGRARHTIADHANDIAIVGHHVIKTGGLDLVHARGKVARRRVEPIRSRAQAITLNTVTTDAALAVDLLTLIDIARVGHGRATHPCNSGVYI